MQYAPVHRIFGSQRLAIYLWPIVLAYLCKVVAGTVPGSEPAAVLPADALQAMISHTAAVLQQLIPSTSVQQVQPETMGVQPHHGSGGQLQQELLPSAGAASDVGASLVGHGEHAHTDSTAVGPSIGKNTYMTMPAPGGTSGSGSSSSSSSGEDGMTVAAENSSASSSTAGNTAAGWLAPTANSLEPLQGPDSLAETVQGSVRRLMSDTSQMMSQFVEKLQPAAAGTNCFQLPQQTCVSLREAHLTSLAYAYPYVLGFFTSTWAQLLQILLQLLQATSGAVVLDVKLLLRLAEQLSTLAALFGGIGIVASVHRYFEIIPF